jgi:type III pantothenate kinase
VTSRALLLDVGNTRVKWGVFDGKRISRTGNIGHVRLKDSGFSALTRRLPHDVGSVLVSNVAGQDFATQLARVLGMHCNTDIRLIRSEKEAHGITNSYRQPRRLGVDRWAAMIGARAESKSALCIVDAGSAITIDGLNRDGLHLGGQIIPGLHLMHRALERDTAGISGLKVRAGAPGSGMSIFANSTSGAVQAGALNAICGAIERAVKIMRAEGLRPRIVLTGGGASPILKQLGGNVLHRPHLVLQGLAAMLQQ